MSPRLVGSLIAVLLVTALVFLVLGMLGYVLSALRRGVARLFAGGPGTDGPPPLAGRLSNPGRPLRVEPAGRCPNQRCRKINVPQARYCARCGQPLHGGRAVGQQHE